MKRLTVFAGVEKHEELGSRFVWLYVLYTAVYRYFVWL